MDKFKYSNLQKKVIMESGGVLLFDLRCYTKIKKMASLKSTMNFR